MGRSKKGFTLVELLVVISILGVLAAALTTQVTKARTMGHSIRCKTNLKNLAQAALTYAVDSHAEPRGFHQPDSIMPWAGSHEASWPSGEDYKEMFFLRPGWVSWTWSGGFLWPNRNPQSGATKVACFYGDKDTTYNSISNGVLWSYVGGDLATYVCDTHKAACKRAGVHKLNAPIRRSYVMNAYFGYDYRVSGARKAVGRSVNVNTLSERGNAGGLLLFAELPAFEVSGASFTERIDVGLKASDGVLETKISRYDSGKAITPSPEEIIGFNHKVGKRFVAHVAFADGHVDAVIAPDKLTKTKLQDLTCLMCNGMEVPADSGQWSSVRNEYVQ